MLLVFLNAAGACVLLASRAPWRERMAKLAGLAGAGILFAGLTSPFWFSFLETLKASYTSYDIPGASQIQPGMLLGAFDEVLYRLARGGRSAF